MRSDGEIKRYIPEKEVEGINEPLRIYKVDSINNCEIGYTK